MKERTKRYFKENLGAPFIIAFMVALITSAGFLILGKEYYANAAATGGFFLLMIGVGLQTISFVRSNKMSSNEDQYYTQ